MEMRFRLVFWEWLLRSERRSGLFDDFEAEFFDDRVGQDFFRQAFYLLFRSFAGGALEVQDEELALTDILNGAEAEGRQGVLNGLSLWIENRTLRHYPDMSFHAGIIPSRGR